MMNAFYYLKSGQAASSEMYFPLECLKGSNFIRSNSECFFFFVLENTRKDRKIIGILDINKKKIKEKLHKSNFR